MSIQLRVYMQNILIHKQIEMFANTLKSGEMFPYNLWSAMVVIQISDYLRHSSKPLPEQSMDL